MRYKYVKGVELIKGLSDVDALFKLESPHFFRIKGRDSSRGVLVSCLMHGCEPAGFRAVLREINSEPEYPIDVYFLVVNVKASQIRPYFTNRFVPGEQNFNRVWRDHSKTEDELTAHELWSFIKKLPLKGVLDLHSFTAKTTPPHTVVVDDKSAEIAKNFTEFVFKMDIPMGAMIEKTSNMCPSFVVESGTNNSSEADEFAFQTLQKFFVEFNLKPGENKNVSRSIFTTATNFKIKENIWTVFSDKKEYADLTIRKDIATLNITEVSAGELFGWSDSLDIFNAKDSKGPSNAKHWFTLDTGKIFFKKDCVPNFMAANEKIAKESGFYLFKKK